MVLKYVFKERHHRLIIVRIFINSVSNNHKIFQQKGRQRQLTSEVFELAADE